MKKTISVSMLLVLLLSLFSLGSVAEGTPLSALNWFKQPEMDYQDIEYFESNLYVYTDSQGKKGLIDNEGNIIVNAVYERFERCTCGNILVSSADAVELNIYSYTVERSVTEKPHSIYTSFYGYDAASGKLYQLTVSDRFSGKEYTGPDAVVFEEVSLTFDSATGGFKNDETVHSGKYGIYAADGQMIGGEYTDAVGFSDGICAVFNGSKWAYADTSGKLLTEFVYDASKVSTHVADEAEVYLVSDGLIPVNRDGQWGYIDMTGQEKVACLFEKTTPSVEGKAWVRYNGKWGIADLSSIPVMANAVHITGIASGTAVVGNTVALSYSPEPAQGKITWGSSDENLATINENGQVLCKGAGTVELTAYNEAGMAVGSYWLQIAQTQASLDGEGTSRFNPTAWIIAVLSVLLAAALICCGYFLYRLRCGRTDKET